MKRRILIALLSFGTVAGFGAGFFSMGARAHARHLSFERHVADVCADSALRSRRERGALERGALERGAFEP